MYISAFSEEIFQFVVRNFIHTLVRPEAMSLYAFSHEKHEYSLELWHCIYFVRMRWFFLDFG